MSDKPWETQKKLKYRDHDFVLSDLKSHEIEVIRGLAIRDCVETKESDNVKLIVTSFMGFLTSKGFRIVKKEDKP